MLPTALQLIESGVAGVWTVGHTIMKSRYSITVEGLISKRFLAQLNMSASLCDTGGKPMTVLTGEVFDQGALIGMLNALYDMGFCLVSVENLSKKINDV